MRRSVRLDDSLSSASGWERGKDRERENPTSGYHCTVPFTVRMEWRCRRKHASVDTSDGVAVVSQLSCLDATQGLELKNLDMIISLP